jgi:hypothetical protein
MRLRGYWATGLLGYWATGLLGYWATGLLGYWEAGRRRPVLQPSKVFWLGNYIMKMSVIYPTKTNHPKPNSAIMINQDDPVWGKVTKCK